MRILLTNDDGFDAEGMHALRRIAAALSEAGLGTVKGGTLYPLLGRLETAGHLEAQWLPGDGGPGRKVYVLTDSGRRHLADQRDRWADFTTLTTALIEGETTGVRR